MKEKLTLEQIQNYLAYDVNVLLESPCFMDGRNMMKIVGRLNFDMIDEVVLVEKTQKDRYESSLEYIKLILRPLSDLTKEIEINGERFVPMNIFWLECGGGLSNMAEESFKQQYYDNIVYTPIDSLAHGTVKNLIKWHFDVFGLIDKGLAIDINTLK